MTELPRYVYEKDELKAKLNIAFAAAELGTVFDGDGLALCPFHEDHEHPNLELMAPGDDGFPWYFCRACGEAGDVIKFIQKRRGVSFPTALMIGSEMYERQPASFELAVPKKRTTYEVTPAWEQKLSEYRERAEEHRQIGLLSYSYGFTTEETPGAQRQAWDEHLLGWGWCLDPLCQVVIPHRDAEGGLRAVKVRHRDRSWKTYGKLDSLYGAWLAKLDPERGAVVLCEGESDTVWASRSLALDPSTLQELGIEHVDCLGLPSGAQSFQPAWLDVLGRYGVVFNAIDNDEAGDRATPKWEERLGDRDIRRVLLPRGRDLREAGHSLRTLLANAEPRGVTAEVDQLDEELGTVTAG